MSWCSRRPGGSAGAFEARRARRTGSTSAPTSSAGLDRRPGGSSPMSASSPCPSRVTSSRSSSTAACSSAAGRSSTRFACRCDRPSAPRSRARARACGSPWRATSASPGHGPASRRRTRGGACWHMATTARSPTGSARFPGDADLMFRATVTRSTAEPEEITAGAGTGYFALVWSAGSGLSRNIVGGAQVLIDGIAAELPGRIVTDADVQEVVQEDELVRVRYRAGRGRPRALRAARHRGRQGLRRRASHPRSARGHVVCAHLDPVRPDRRHGDADERDAADAMGRSVRARDSQACVQHALQHRQRPAAAQRRARPRRKPDGVSLRPRGARDVRATRRRGGAGVPRRSLCDLPGGPRHRG